MMAKNHHHHHALSSRNATSGENSVACGSPKLLPINTGYHWIPNIHILKNPRVSLGHRHFSELHPASLAQSPRCHGPGAPWSPSFQEVAGPAPRGTSCLGDGAGTGWPHWEGWIYNQSNRSVGFMMRVGKSSHSIMVFVISKIGTIDNPFPNW